MSLPRVLVVDDDEESRDLLREVLEANGYSVEAVADAQKAREILDHDGGFAVLIADLRMPNETGLELIRHLRQQNRRQGIILMSSFISAPERKLAKQLGAHALLEKPFRLNEFLQTVGELAGNSPVGTSP